MRSGTIAFLVGVTLLQLLPRLPSPIWALPLVLLAALAWVRPGVRWAAFLVAGFLWVWLRAGLVLGHGLPAALEGRDLVITGTVSGLPVRRGRGTRFAFDVASMRRSGGPRLASPGRIRLSWYGAVPALQPGARWRLIVRLKRPHGFFNPGGFDYERWLFVHRIRATGYVRDGPANRRLSAAAGHWIDRARQRLRDGILQALHGSPYAGVIAALAVGARSGIDAALWRMLRRTGTSHLVAISGLHIGLVAGLALFLARRLWALCGSLALRLAAPRAGALAGLAAALGYALLAGLSIPTQRALVMIAVVMVAQIAGRRWMALDILAAALGAVLIWDPLSVLAAGFWLSFGAVALMLYAMQGRVGTEGLWWRWGRVQLVLALGMLPLVLVFFDQQPLLGCLANLAAVPFLGFVLVPLVLAGTLLLPLLPSAAALLLHGAAEAFACLAALLKALASLPFAVWHHAVVSPWPFALAMVGVLMLLAPRGVPLRWVGLCWLLPLLVNLPARPPPGELWLSVLDVGQGLAAVARTHAHVLVFDTGPRFGRDFDAGRAVLVPFLRQAGVRRLDKVIVSHGDNDHIGGLASLLDAIPAAQVLSSVPRATRVPGARHCHAGQRWRWDGVAFRMLHPPPDSRRRGNNGSCVLRIEAAGQAVLLPGDIEAPAERALLRRYGRQLHAAVLIAPHHGSKTSSTAAFLRAVDPGTVLFAVGYRNRFRFPDAGVAARYAALGARSLRTGYAGALRVRIGRRGVTVSAWRPAARHYWNAP